MIELHWTDVDGVPTVWTEAPGPLRAGLLFQTGRADETVVTAGQTHLIEHMVLSVINNRFSNGSVEDLFTTFVTMGRPDDLCAFFAQVCKVLRSLPADRLEIEKKILPAEAATRAYDFCGNLLMWRYGAARHGLRALAEFGTRNATLEQLHKCREQRFTRGNAVLWLSGAAPANLSLDLPPGEKQPLPALCPVQPTVPAWFIDDRCGGIAVAGIVPRVAASSIFSLTASIRLHERLRAGQAVSYNPLIVYEPLNADTAHLVLYADSDHERRVELADAFGEAVEKLTEFEDMEVEAARKQYVDCMTGPMAPAPSDRSAMEVQRAAMDWLSGREHESLEFLASEAEAVSTADVAAFGCEMQRTALFALPSKAKARPSMGVQAPPSNGPAVEGREVPNMDAPIRRERLVYGPDGASIRWPDGSHITARYSDLAAALYYEDGCICLISSDATFVVIEPTLWRNGASICRAIRERVPVDLLLQQGSRPADAIPKPETSAWQRFRSSVSRGR